jgi:hypothetical protein
MKSDNGPYSTTAIALFACLIVLMIWLLAR